ncbi:hypothetical protein DOS70_09450 [Staphylococcus felis]|uniref:Uncharacterized protein n=1 Tax=Staphylococcus felis TaxID=46127 RepID=A0A2K3Z9M0_9STAP|nr:hypothetical protein [Staphylococcus felis]AVP37391.1 hypothetical protein C7J90_10645 [Staphylococcus felis]MBH9580161.1 hypothetical protein [Staphylococcus felis]MDM8328286.1 hypothetical protein [Staphylococcus felis]MDQ7192944.1 hypothetical protein [Staphylococcus felis]PNZ34542.1 hypothetical protein CD143_08600 [Staphylococcus felis]
MVLIWILGLMIACFIVVGVLKKSHWLFNILAAALTFVLFIVDFIIFGWHPESIKIILLCIIIIVFELAHMRIKMVQKSKM